MRCCWSQYGFPAVLGFFIWSGTLAAAPKPTEVVAEVDGYKITVVDVEKKLNEIAASRTKENGRELKQAAVNEAINEHLIKLRAASLS